MNNVYRDNSQFNAHPKKEYRPLNCKPRTRTLNATTQTSNRQLRTEYVNVNHEKMRHTGPGPQFQAIKHAQSTPSHHPNSHPLLSSTPPSPLYKLNNPLLLFPNGYTNSALSDSPTEMLIAT